MISTETVKHVRIVTWARPEVRNAFNFALYESLADALRSAEAEADVHVVVLTGAGTAFSSGQDLRELAEIAAGTAPQGVEHGFLGLLEVLERYPVPLLAAVNGVAVGLGLTILAHCDVVLVADTARLRLPFTEMGVPPEAASSYLLPARMGWQRAAHLMLSSEWIDADEAVASGLAWRKCAPSLLMDETLRVAEAIAVRPAHATRTIKRLLVEAQLPAVVAARAREEAAFAEVFAHSGPLE